MAWREVTLSSSSCEEFTSSLHSPQERAGRQNHEAGSAPMSDASPQAPSNLRRPHGTASTHLDALRGVAAVGVCLSHLRDFFFQDYAKLPHHNLLLAAVYLVTGLGHQWVIVFFVLSGYLVGGSVLRSVAVNRWSWRVYLLNRLTRLYAVLVPALVFGGLIDLI